MRGILEDMIQNIPCVEVEAEKEHGFQGAHDFGRDTASREVWQLEERHASEGLEGGVSDLLELVVGVFALG